MVSRRGYSRYAIHGRSHRGEQRLRRRLVERLAQAGHDLDGTHSLEWLSEWERVRCYPVNAHSTHSASCSGELMPLFALPAPSLTPLESIPGSLDSEASKNVEIRPSTMRHTLIGWDDRARKGWMHGANRHQNTLRSGRFPIAGFLNWVGCADTDTGNSTGSTR